MTLDGRDAADVGGQGVGQVVGRPADRRDRAGIARRAGLVVVAHDDDRVGAARSGRGLDRVVADPAHRVERELVAGRDRVELRPDRLDEGGEFVGVGRRDRLEVEVDAVGAAIADGRRDLAGEVVAGGRRYPAATSGVPSWLEVQPKLWTVSTTRAPLAWAGIDDVGQVRAGPAAPADGRRAVGCSVRWRSPLAAAPTPK